MINCPILHHFLLHKASQNYYRWLSSFFKYFFPLFFTKKIMIEKYYFHKSQIKVLKLANNFIWWRSLNFCVLLDDQQHLINCVLFLISFNSSNFAILCILRNIRSINIRSLLLSSGFLAPRYSFLFRYNRKYNRKNSWYQQKLRFRSCKHCRFRVWNRCFESLLKNVVFV